MPEKGQVRLQRYPFSYPCIKVERKSGQVIWNMHPVHCVTKEAPDLKVFFSLHVSPTKSKQISKCCFFWSTYKQAVFVHLFWFLHTDTIFFKTLFFLSRGGALCNNFISYVQTTKLLQTMCQLDHKAIKNTFILALT